MEKKMTKREMFNEVIAIATEVGREDIVEFANHEIELLEKKASKSGSTKTQKENVEIMTRLIEELDTIGKAVTITEMQRFSEYAGTFSNQKISALLKKLVDEGKVVKTVDKKKSYFSVA